MKKLLGLLLFLLLCSCGEIPSETSYKPMQYSMNGVKLISPSISNPRDDKTMLQPLYSINESRRLLIRFEDFANHSENVIVNEENRVIVTLTINENLTINLEDVVNEIKICPLKKNWMMLATWNKSHPFPGGNGSWDAPGGDYDEVECLTHWPNPEQAANIIRFDISDWFLHNVRSREKNYGFVIISSIDAVIFGDTHSSYSPEVSWNQ